MDNLGHNSTIIKDKLPLIFVKLYLVILPRRLIIKMLVHALYPISRHISNHFQ